MVIHQGSLHLQTPSTYNSVQRRTDSPTFHKQRVPPRFSPERRRLNLFLRLQLERVRLSSQPPFHTARLRLSERARLGHLRLFIRTGGYHTIRASALLARPPSHHSPLEPYLKGATSQPHTMTATININTPESILRRTAAHEAEDAKQYVDNMLASAWKQWPNEAGVSLPLQVPTLPGPYMPSPPFVSSPSFSSSSPPPSPSPSANTSS